jgi:flagellar hook-associated protein 1 FlgK
MTASSLNKIMGMGTESLFNARVGVDVTGHNIANAHTDGYSRQIVETTGKLPATYGPLVFGTGAEIQTIRRAHDSYIERQLGQELQNNGHFTALSSGLKNIEDIFSPELTSTIRERADQFENALREFSNYPEELPVRVNLVDTAAKLTDAFNTTHANVADVQKNLTAEIRQNIGSSNMKLREVARLNVEISAAEVGSKNPANDLLDRRDKLIRELSEQMDIKVYGDKNSKVILRGPGDVLLVEGAHSAQLDLRSDGDGSNQTEPLIQVSDVKGDNWTSINSKFQKGKIAGLVQARDVFAARVRDQVNDFARDFASEFNRVHRTGYGVAGYRESSGRDFFTGLNEGTDAAETLKVSELIVSDPEAVAAAMSPNSPGDNIIANEMIRFFREPLFGEGRMTFGNSYEAIIGQIGTDVQQSADERDASNLVLAQIKANKESIAGVSLDEEAQNMMKYQNAFNASSKLITTADEMMQTVLDLKR